MHPAFRSQHPRGVAADRSLEVMNDLQKEHNTGWSLLSSLLFTSLLQPMLHVYRQWKLAARVGSSDAIGVRASVDNEVDILVELFKAKLGSDLTLPSDSNPFWHTGNAVNMRTGPAKTYRPCIVCWTQVNDEYPPRSNAQAVTAAPAPVSGRPRGWHSDGHSVAHSTSAPSSSRPRAAALGRHKWRGRRGHARADKSWGEISLACWDFGYRGARGHDGRQLSVPPALGSSFVQDGARQLPLAYLLGGSPSLAHA